MADNITAPAETVQVEIVNEKKSRFKNFTSNHPCATKVLGITAAAAAVAGVVAAVKNKKSDDDSASTSTPAYEGDYMSSPETFPVTEA